MTHREPTPEELERLQALLPQPSAAPGISLNQTFYDGYTSLHDAARNNQVEHARMLLKLPETKVDVEEKTAKQSPLHWAALYGRIEMAHFLLKNEYGKADIQKRDSSGLSPLHLTAQSGEAFMAYYLLQSGAALDAEDDEGRTPLMWAALNGHLDCVCLFLERGAKVNLQDHDQRTALHWAAQQDRVAVCKVLMENGAKAELRDRHGLLPLDLGKAHGHRRIIVFFTHKPSPPLLSKDQQGLLPFVLIPAIFYVLSALPFMLLLKCLAVFAIVFFLVRSWREQALFMDRNAPAAAPSRPLSPLEKICSLIGVNSRVTPLGADQVDASRAFFSASVAPDRSTFLPVRIFQASVVVTYASFIVIVFPELNLTAGGALLLALFFVLSIAMVVSYLQLLQMNPGVVVPAGSNNDRNSVLQRVASGRSLKEHRICVTCKIWKRSRSFHCSMCGSCILRFDHHCPWINNCVGLGNHRLFMFFLTLLLVNQLLYVKYALDYTTSVTNIPFFSLSESIPAMFHQAGFVSWVLGYVIMNLSWEGFLFYTQVSNILANRTLYEGMHRFGHGHGPMHGHGGHSNKQLPPPPGSSGGGGGAPAVGDASYPIAESDSSTQSECSDDEFYAPPVNHGPLKNFQEFLALTHSYKDLPNSPAESV
jgi:hypothetical protein